MIYTEYTCIKLVFAEHAQNRISGLPDGVLGSRFDPKWLFFGVPGYDGVITGYFENSRKTG